MSSSLFRVFLDLLQALEVQEVASHVEGDGGVEAYAFAVAPTDDRHTSSA